MPMVDCQLTDELSLCASVAIAKWVNCVYFTHKEGSIHRKSPEIRLSRPQPIAQSVKNLVETRCYEFVKRKGHPRE